MDPTTQFTVLLPVWRRDDHVLLAAALESIVGNSLRPQQILVCADGELTREQEVVLANFPVDIVRNPGPTFGLHHNLNNALAHVTTPWIARADADDINLCDRFTFQVRAITDNPSLDVVGTDLIEVMADGTEVLKRMPATHKQIAEMAPYRCPLNHNTVFVRLASLVAVGGYPNVPKREDYALWLRMLTNGHCFGNISQPLVRMTMGSDFYSRRSGLSAVSSELMIGELRRELPGVGRLVSAAVTASRITAMAMGPHIVRPIYKIMRRSY